MIPSPPSPSLRPGLSGSGITCILALGILVAGIPSANAGSRGTPEISDPRGDGAPGGRDILGVWFDLTIRGDERFLNVSMELGEAFQSNVWLFEQWAVWFKPTAGTPAGRPYAYVSFWGNTVVTTPSMNAMLGFVAEPGTFEHREREVRFAAAAAGARLHANVSMASFPGFRIGVDSFTLPKAAVVREASQSGGEPPEVPRVVVETYDTAPDVGVGRDYKPSGAFGLTNFTVEAPSSPVMVIAGMASSAPLTIRNLGTSEINVSVAAYPSASLHLTLDPARLTLAPGANGTVLVHVAPEEGKDETRVVGITASTPDATTRVVSVTFEIRDERPEPAAAFGSSSASPTGSKKADTPFLGIPELFLAGALVAWLRRRDA